jgi:hypothetical protein
VKHAGGRKAAFWASVAVVSVLANFGVELLAEKYPQLGLARFVAFTHKGAS